MLDGNCYPELFGVGACKPWEALHDPACLSHPSPSPSRPAYCDEPWCYVDPITCEARQTGKTYRASDLLIVPTSWPGEKPYYSYETCGGNTEAWTENIVTASLSGRVLKAGIPESYYPEHFMIDQNGAPLPDGPITSGASLSGVWIEYVRQEAATLQARARAKITRCRCCRRCSSAAEAGKRVGCRGGIPRKKHAARAGEVAHVLSRTCAQPHMCSAAHVLSRTGSLRSRFARLGCYPQC
jgi:hypothetical protein